MDVNKLWTAEVCQEVAEEIFANFDQNGDGSLDFEVGDVFFNRVMEWNRGFFGFVVVFVNDFFLLCNYVDDLPSFVML